MPASEEQFGVHRHEGEYIDSVETEDKVERKGLRNRVGTTKRVHAYDQMTSGTVKGHGETSVAVGIGESGVNGISNGTTIILTFKNTEANEEWDGWEYTFEHWPEATGSGVGA